VGWERPARLLGTSLLALLPTVVAGLAEAPQVALIPEQRLVTAVRLAVVGHQQRGVRLDPAAAPPLAGEQVAAKDRHAQLLPTRRLVPLPPTALIALPIERLAINRRRSKPRPQRPETWTQAGQLYDDRSL